MFRPLNVCFVFPLFQRETVKYIVINDEKYVFRGQKIPQNFKVDPETFSPALLRFPANIESAWRKGQKKGVELNHDNMELAEFFLTKAALGQIYKTKSVWVVLLLYKKYT